MNKIILGVGLSFLTSMSFAKTQISVGTGYQHASMLGAQLAYIDGDNRYYAAAGIVGYGVGYERMYGQDKKHSIGLALGAEEITSEDGFLVLTYSYYFEGSNEPGWRIGASIGKRREDTFSFFGDNDDVRTSTAVSFDLSYMF